MGQRGPKPGQYTMRMLPAGAPTAKAGPRYTSGEPDMPKHLGKAARAVWKRTVREMSAAGALAVADRDILAAYCVAVADLEALSARIEADGLMVDVPTFDRNGQPTGATVCKPHPALKHRSDLMNKVRQFADALGLNPAARAKAGTAAEVPAAPGTGNRVLSIRDRIQAARAAGEKNTG